MITPRIAYIVPVHNSADHLAATVAALRTRLRDFPGSQAILVENGSADASPRLVRDLAGEDDGVEVVAAVSPKGLGNAYRRGLELVDPRCDLVVLTASDLPFRFTDLDAYMKLAVAPPLAIGSKAHPDSQIQVSRLRRLLSVSFRMWRQLLLRLRAGDTQGTLIVDRVLISRVRPWLRSDDYLISTEIVAWLQELGTTAVEVPVTYERSGSSTVSPLADSVRMALGTWRLAQRVAARRRYTQRRLAHPDTTVSPRARTMSHLPPRG